MLPLEDTLSRHEVRLFPSIHISSGREAELRATASLLAMAKAVSEFGRAVVAMAGGPRGRLDCYTEIPINTPEPDDAEIRPDGLLVVRRGKKEWKAFVEVKVGDAPLKQDQLDAYHRQAGVEGVDAVVTISNQTALPNGLPPLTIDKRRLRRVTVTHISWERLLSEARLLSNRKDIDDPDQHWMLEEWIKYLADPLSQIIDPPDLGQHWSTILKSAKMGALEAESKNLEDVVAHWDSFERKLAFRLRAKLGVDVQPVLSRADKAEPAVRLKRLHREALQTRSLVSVLRIPDAAGDVTVTVLLAGKAVRYSISMKAPTQGRVKTRLSWLARQLKGATMPPEASIAVRWDHRGLHSFASAAAIVKEPAVLLRAPDGNPIPQGAMPRTFDIESTVGLVRGRGRSTAPVLEGVAVGLERFYRDVIEHLRAYVPPAPKLSGQSKENDALHAQPEEPSHAAPAGANPQGGDNTSTTPLPQGSDLASIRTRGQS